MHWKHMNEAVSRMYQTESWWKFVCGETLILSNKNFEIP